MKIVRAKGEDAATFTDIALGAKRHWRYPERWIEAWRDTLTVRTDFINANETYAAIVDGRMVGFYALCPTVMFFAWSICGSCPIR